jgi:hypothetical protein
MMAVVVDTDVDADAAGFVDDARSAVARAFAGWLVGWLARACYRKTKIDFLLEFRFVIIDDYSRYRPFYRAEGDQSW